MKNDSRDHLNKIAQHVAEAASEGVNKFVFLGQGGHGWYVVLSKAIQTELKKILKLNLHGTVGFYEVQPTTQMVTGKQANKDRKDAIEELQRLFKNNVFLTTELGKPQGVVAYAVPREEEKTASPDKDTKVKAEKFYQALKTIFAREEQEINWLFIHECQNWISPLEFEEIANKITVKETKAELVKKLPQSGNGIGKPSSMKI